MGGRGVSTRFRCIFSPERAIQHPPQQSPNLYFQPKIHSAKLRAFHQPSLERPGLAPVVGVITPQMKSGSTRNLAGESSWKRIRRRKKTRNYPESQRVNRKYGMTAAKAQNALRVAVRNGEILRSQILGSSLPTTGRACTAEHAEQNKLQSSSACSAPLR